MSCENSPCAVQRGRSNSDGERDVCDERPERMRDWLIRMINSDRFPGLIWLDAEKTIFKVPWVHAKKRGYCRERDAALFREWAVHSGKYRDESDPTVWKINFRCAINGLKDIQEIKDMQSEDARVYKVFPSRRGNKRRRCRPRFPSTEPYPSSAVFVSDGQTHHIFNHAATLPYSSCSQVYTPPSCQYSPTSMKLEYGGSTCVPAVCATQTSYPCISSAGLTTTTSHMMDRSCVSSTVADGHLNEAAFFDSPLPPVSAIHDSIPDIGLSMSRQGSPDSGIVESQNSPPPQILANEQPHSTMSPITSCAMNIPTSLSASSSNPILDSNNDDIVQLVEALDNTHSPTPPLSAAPCSKEIQIRILYGSIPVHTETITCDRGCRIFFDPRYPDSFGSMEASQARKLFGPADAFPIQLPSRHPQPLASELFKAMVRGLLIEVDGSDIYATPLCRAVVYHGQSSTQQSQHLEKDQCTKVFDYVNQFRPGLEHYALFNSPPPAPYVVFSLGQGWGPGRHVAQNLISIVVTHSLAKHELDMVGLPHALARDLLTDIPETVEIEQANVHDLEAEAFLSQYVSLQ